MFVFHSSPKDAPGSLTGPLKQHPTFIQACPGIEIGNGRGIPNLAEGSFLPRESTPILFIAEGTKAQRGCDLPVVTNGSVAELELCITLPSAQGHFP